ncbi:hypothetical protein BCR32DRAFT_265423 [Anaeromyces robustus]|uniref:Ankyrin n=1 Tax=Anaeromyces robustus TaxID=1754192 RepID=A0A1Y1XJ50_9FUNG|nr:hypothetical protein BCR32DRAFT_265423 [Anaeromyces robustus]|eukprot:ORX85785.1 hypothetical protein BCR32DRAFT_265423 [Anaeromyces robustus]
MVKELDSETSKLVIEQQQKRDNIIKIIQENNILEIKKYIKNNSIDLKELNKSVHNVSKYMTDDNYNNLFDTNGFDVLITSIENDITLDKIKFLMDECQYETLNYHIYNKKFGRRSPLLSALLKHDYNIADYLINYGADINYDICYLEIIYYLDGLNKLDEKTLKYIIRKGYDIKKIENYIISNFLEKNQSHFIGILIKKFIYDNKFILNLLNYYKNKTPLSDELLTKMINDEKSKLKVKKEWYGKVLANNDFDTFELLYHNDIRPEKEKFDELMEDLQDYDMKHHTNAKYKFLSKIKNKDLAIEVETEFLRGLSLLPNYDTQRNAIIELIKENNEENLKQYINDNNIDLSKLNNEEFDLLIYAIENEVSPDMFAFLMVEGKYRTVNYHIKTNDGKGFKTPLITAIVNKQYILADILFANGADGNYHIKEYIPEPLKYLSKSSVPCVIPIYLYENNLLTKDNFAYLTITKHNNKLFLSHDIIKKFVSDKRNDLIMVVCKNVVRRCFIPWYEEAIKCDNYEAIQLFLEADERDKKEIGLDLARIFNKEEYRMKRDIVFAHIDDQAIKNAVNLNLFLSNIIPL